MRILVDADACPVVFQVEQIAREYKIPVTLLSTPIMFCTQITAKSGPLAPEKMPWIWH